MPIGVQELNLQRVRLEVKAGSELEEVELRVVELLDQVITDCRYTLILFITIQPSHVTSN